MFPFTIISLLGGILMKREILTASRSKLNVLGKTIIDIDINGYVCSNVAIVADINVDGILGLDLHRSQLHKLLCRFYYT
jgi:hypothetical protein